MAKNFFTSVLRKRGRDNHDIILPLSRRTAPSPFHSHGALRMGNEGGREAATCNITVLTILSGSVHKCASKPASERATERQRRFGLPDRTALPPLPLHRRRRGVISAPLAPPPALLPSRWRRRRGGGRQTDVCPTLKSSLSLHSRRPSVVRSVRRPTTVARSLARLEPTVDSLPGLTNTLSCSFVRRQADC